MVVNGSGLSNPIHIAQRNVYFSAGRRQPQPPGTPPSSAKQPFKYKTPFPTRSKLVKGWAAATAVTAFAASRGSKTAQVGLVVLGALGLVGARDITQKEHPLKITYPGLANGRYFLERFRKEIQQYFIAMADEEQPYSRLAREQVYRLAKGEPNIGGFGSEMDEEEIGHRTFLHSMMPVWKKDVEEMGVTVGGADCKQPYKSSRFNISGMSYGALSGPAMLALNQGAKLGGFSHNTGEGGISPYHLGIQDPFREFKQAVRNGADPKAYPFDFWKIVEDHKDELKNGADIVWNIGTGYFGCRDENGNFDPQEFQRKATLPNVKMIELKLSQGAKPGGEAHLPASKNAPLIAAIRGVEPWTDVYSPPYHSAFSNPLGMVQFIKQLRDLSGGKPVGFKFCLGQRYQFLAICKAMVETGIYPDFITIDGSEGGTGSAPINPLQNGGTLLEPALWYVHNALTGFGIRDKIKLNASGKVATAFDMYTKKAMGADMFAAGRPFLFTLGCIQARECHKNTCGPGITTQNPELTKAVHVDVRGPMVRNYGVGVQDEFAALLAMSGLTSPEGLNLNYLQEVVPHGLTSLSDVMPRILPGSLKHAQTVPDEWKSAWRQANPKTFLPSPV